MPSVPEHVAVAAVDQGMGPLTARWSTRYQSRVFRDVDNAVAVPAYTVHDASIDARWPALGAEIDTGVAVMNVFDVSRLPIEAPGTRGSKGYTSYSDLDGYPLPGRQWRLTVAAKF